MNPPLTPTESPESPAITIGSRVRVRVEGEERREGVIETIDRADKEGLVYEVKFGKSHFSWYRIDELELLPAESPDDLRAQADELDDLVRVGSSTPEYHAERAAELRARAKELEYARTDAITERLEGRSSEGCADDACAVCGSRYGGHGNGSLRCPEMHGKHKRVGWLSTKFTPAQPKQGPTKGALSVWLREKLAEAEARLRSRKQMAEALRSGTNAEWAAASNLHPSTAGRKSSKKERISRAASHERIAAKYLRDVEMIHEAIRFANGPTKAVVKESLTARTFANPDSVEWDEFIERTEDLETPLVEAVKQLRQLAEDHARLKDRLANEMLLLDAGLTAQVRLQEQLAALTQELAKVKGAA